MPDDDFKVVRLRKLEPGDVLTVFFPLAAPDHERLRVCNSLEKLYPNNSILPLDSVIRLEVFRPEPETE